MIIPFTQFLLPDGRERRIEYKCKPSLEKPVQFLIESGARFECEVLMTGQVSLTVEYEVNGEDQTLAHEISENGPAIENAITYLVGRAHQRLIEIKEIIY